MRKWLVVRAARSLEEGTSVRTCVTSSAGKVQLAAANPPWAAAKHPFNAVQGQTVYWPEPRLDVKQGINLHLPQSLECPKDEREREGMVTRILMIPGLWY